MIQQNVNDDDDDFYTVPEFDFRDEVDEALKEQELIKEKGK